MNISAILILAGLGVGGFFLGKLLFKADTRTEDRRRRAIEISQWASANGLPEISKLLVAYSIGDYSFLLHSLRSISDTLANDESARALVNRFLSAQLTKKLSTVEGKEELIAMVERALNVKINREAIAPSATELEKVVS